MSINATAIDDIGKLLFTMLYTMITICVVLGIISWFRNRSK